MNDRQAAGQRMTEWVEDESSADRRAREVEQQMTDDERFSLVISVGGATRFTGGVRHELYPEDAPLTAGYTPGVPRLGVPALLSSDASMGVTNPGFRPDDKGATAMPASVLVGASFNPKLARDGGAAIAREARSRGFNVQLAGGINLARDLHNGRTYEYYSEDPWLSAVLGAETVTASFTVANTGDRAGADVPQLYLTDGPGERRMRLLGFERVELAPVASRQVTMTVDPRLLARFDGTASQWRIASGTHRVALGRAADDLVLTADVELSGRLFGR